MRRLGFESVTWNHGTGLDGIDCRRMWQLVIDTGAHRGADRGAGHSCTAHRGTGNSGRDDWDSFCRADHRAGERCSVGRTVGIRVRARVSPGVNRRRRVSGT